MQGTPITADRLRELSIAHADLANSLDTFEVLTGTTLTLLILHQPRFDASEMLAAIDAAENELTPEADTPAPPAQPLAPTKVAPPRITPLAPASASPVEEHIFNLPRDSWTLEEDFDLLRLRTLGHMTAELAEMLGRDSATIIPRINTLIGRPHRTSGSSSFTAIEVRDALAKILGLPVDGNEVAA